MPIDGLPILNTTLSREILPNEINFQAQEASNLHASMKKIEESEKQKLDPNGNRQKGQRQKNRQNKEQKENEDQQKAISRLFVDVAEPAKSDVQYNQKAVDFAENKKEYKVVYNSYKEIVEIIHLKTGEIQETLSLEELKSFIMRVKNPLGIIVDRTV